MAATGGHITETEAQHNRPWPKSIESDSIDSKICYEGLLCVVGSTDHFERTDVRCWLILLKNSFFDVALKISAFYTIYDFNLMGSQW